MRQHDDTLETLQELSELQTEALGALVPLSSPGASDEAFRHFLDLARRLVAGVAALEASAPGTLRIQDYAHPLATQLLIYADRRQWAGDAPDADRLRAEAVAITSQYLDPVATAEIHRSLATQAAAEGRFHDSLIGLDNARRVLLSAGKILACVQAEIDLANMYEWLGDFERSLTVLRDAHARFASDLADGPPTLANVAVALGRQFIGIMRGNPSTVGEDALTLRYTALKVLLAEARIHRHLGNYDEAERLFGEARPFHAGLSHDPAINFHLAAIAAARGNLDRAERLLSHLRPSFESPPLRSRRPALRQVEADVLLARGMAREALAAAEDGLRDQVAYPDPEAEWKLQWRRAKALAGLQRHAEATPAFRAAMMRADRLRMAPLGYRLDTTFLRDKLPMADEAIDHALATGDAASAIWFIEAVKSRSLSATLSAPGAADAQRTDEEIQIDGLSQRIDALAFAGYSGSTSVDLLRERASLIAERDALLEAVRIRDPRWRLLTEPAPIEVESLSARLGSRRAALSFHYRPGRIVAGVIDGSGVAVGVREVDPAIVDALDRIARNLRRAAPNASLFDVSAAEHVGLEDLIAPEVLQRAVEARTLIVVPHGILHLLPWACMTVGEHRLFERCAVGVLPNLASLPLLDLDPIANPGVALIGAPDYEGLQQYEPLPEVPAEMDDIRALYGDRLIAPPCLGSEATESAFWRLTQEARAPEAILHVSAHGSLEASEPLASGLVLTRSTVDAAELLSRRVSYPEVVLSACSTAWRPQSTHGLELAGDDALGLPASFLEAGARFMLASVTPTGQKSARRFTVAWHRNRRAGLSPLEAYRAVQLELYNNASPALDDWAGMMAIGCR